MRRKRPAPRHDPPELRLLQKRRTKSRAAWPGESIDVRQVMAAWGNPKDGFRSRHREPAPLDYNWMWAQA